MASTTTTKKQIAREIPTFVRVYIDNTVERLRESPYVPPSLEDREGTGVVSKDITISQEKNITARLFLPRQAQPNSQKKIPILVYFHGGAFVLGSASSLSQHRQVTAVVAESQVLAVSVDYRLPPEHPLPVAYEDSWFALNWVASHARNDGPELNGSEKENWVSEFGDFGKLFIGGDSAGANIVHNMATRAGAEGLDCGVRIRGAILIHPYFWGSRPIGNEPSEGHDTALPRLVWDFVYSDAPNGIDNYMINPMGPDAPKLDVLGCDRLLICVAGKDQLRERGVWYYDLVKSSGFSGEVELFESENEGHGFILRDINSDNAKALIKRLASFLMK